MTTTRCPHGRTIAARRDYPCPEGLPGCEVPQVLRIQPAPELGKPFVDMLADQIGHNVRVFAHTWCEGVLLEVGPDWVLVGRNLIRLDAISRVTLPEETS